MLVQYVYEHPPNPPVEEGETFVFLECK
jgi:predicted RNA-binding protein with TRAM domain